MTRATAALTGVLVLGACGRLLAQTATGNLYVTVRDVSGARLPGALAALVGVSGSRSTTSDERGELRLLYLEQGNYTLAVSLAGFAREQQQIVVTTGENVDLDVGLKIAGPSEKVSVTAETPVLDVRKIGTSTTLTYDELHRVPNSRDPWALLRTIPGVVVDRLNIAGNESGQQSLFQGKGADVADTTWHIDGVLFEDPNALGSSAGYYDFGAFQEIAVSTGGKDVSAQTGGVDLQFVVKRGTNRWRGSARGYLTHDDLQWSNIQGTELEGDPRLNGSDKADHIQQISDYGFDLGGPIVRDKLFVFGSFGRQDIRLVRTDQTTDKTVLDVWNAKLNWQISPSTMASLFYFHTSKGKQGRSPGLGVQWDEDALLDQRTGTDAGPHGLAKLELSQVVSPTFFVNVKLSAWSDGFRLDPAGGTGRGASLDFNNGQGHGSILQIAVDEHNHLQALADAHHFRSAWGGTHELKFGFGYKADVVSSTSSLGGDPGLVGIKAGSASVVRVYRGQQIRFGSHALDAYVGDDFTRDRWTLRAGLRFDHRTAWNDPSSVAAQPTFPDLLPAIDYPGGGQGITWNGLSPRLGLSYALGDARRTVLRASLARYTGRLNPRAAAFDNPVTSSYLTYLWQDFNRDGLPEGNEVLVNGPLLEAVGVDPRNPGSVTSVNRIAADYGPPVDWEVIFGVERELFHDLVVGAAYTWRRSTRARSGYSIPFDPGWTPRIGMTSADYIPNHPVTANGYTAQTFSPDPTALAATGGGRILENRPDYHTGYNGLEITATKRLTNRWMTRVAFSYMNGQEHYDGSGAVQNPTVTDAPLAGGISGSQQDGGLYAPYSAGSGTGDVFVNAKWQLSTSFLYQLPASFEVAASLYARQGFPRPIVLLLSAGADGQLRALATPGIDHERYPAVWDLDLSLARPISLGHGRSLRLALEMFNVFNSNTELNRFRQANAAAFHRLDEIMSPRILRLGAQLSF
jgi:hypothetical protein